MPESMESTEQIHDASTRARVWWTFALQAVLAVALLASLAVVLDIGEVVAAAQFHWSWAIASMGIYLAFTLVCTWRWYVMVNDREKIDVSPGVFYVVFSVGLLASHLTTQIIGNLLFRPWLLRRMPAAKQLTGARNYGVVLFEKGLDFALLCILFPTTMLWLTTGLQPWAGIALHVTVIVLGAILMMRYPTGSQQKALGVLEQCIQLLGRIAGQNRPMVQKAKTTIEQVRHEGLMRPQTMRIVFISSTIRYMTMVGMLYTIALTAGLETNLAHWAVVVPTAQVAMILGLTPGSAGVLEYLEISVLQQMGIPSEHSMWTIIVQRLFWIFGTSILIGLAWMVVQWQRQRSVTAP